MKDLIEDLQSLKVTTIAENTWVNKKLVPVSVKLVELQKVEELLKRNPVNDFIRDIITDLENLSNGYRAVNDGVQMEYVIDKADLDAYIQQLEDQIL